MAYMIKDVVVEQLTVPMIEKHSKGKKMQVSLEDAMEKFKQFCLAEVAIEDPEQKLDPEDEEDWHSLSLGFFKALGMDTEACHDLAREARYKHMYWCN